MAEAVIGFVLDQDHLLGLNDHAWLGLLMELEKPHRQALGIRVVLRACGEAFISELLGPGRVRETAFDVLTGLEKGRDRRAFRIVRKRCLGRLERDAATTSASATTAA